MLLHVKPKHANGEAASCDERGRKSEKKKIRDYWLFLLSGYNEAVKVI